MRKLLALTIVCFATAAWAQQDDAPPPAAPAKPAVHALTAEALARGEELEALEVRRPTLEDVYLELTADG